MSGRESRSLVEDKLAGVGMMVVEERMLVLWAQETVGDEM